MPDDQDAVANVQSMISLAQAQIAQQITRIQSIETKALAAVGFATALGAVAAAAQQTFGRRWWAAFPGLILSCVGFIGVTEEADPSDGPDPVAFYEQFGGLSPLEAADQLLADLHEAIDSNREIISRKKSQLVEALPILWMTVVYSACLYIWNR